MLVLLVASDLGLFQEMRRSLRPHGHPVVRAEHTGQARAILRQASPDVIVVDDGNDPAALLGAVAPSTAILLLHRTDDRLATLPALRKPFTDPELLTALHLCRTRLPAII